MDKVKAFFVGVGEVAKSYPYVCGLLFVAGFVFGAWVL